MSANEDASVLRKRGRLVAARTSLGTCTSDACPQMIREDCLKALHDLTAATPAVRFQAMEGTSEVMDVRVLMDNEPLLEKLDGKAVDVDPGDHVFTFFAKGHPTQTQKVSLKEGEKDRVVVIQLGTAPISPSAAHLVVMTEPGAGIVVDGASPMLGRFDGVLTAGRHDVRVTKDGRVPVFLDVDMRGAGETQVKVALQNDKPTLLPWIIGGAIVAAGLLVGGGIVIAAGK